MSFRFSIIFVVVLTALSLSGNSFGQSNFDLLPPMQADLDSDQIRMSPDPDALPRFQFAVLCLGESKAEIITNSPKQKMLAEIAKREAPEGHVFYTENVTQNYTVAVPYTEEVDGVQVEKIRYETRTRTVPVQKIRKMTAPELAASKKKRAEMPKEDKEAKPVATQHAVTVSYTIEVPYTDTNDRGEQVQKIRKETRTRAIQVYRGKTETTSEKHTSSHPLESLSFFNASGAPVALDSVKETAGDERLPVVLIQSKDHIDPYFELILKPETLFVTIKKDK